MGNTQLRRLAPVIALGILALTALVVQFTPNPGDAMGTGSDDAGARSATELGQPVSTSGSSKTAVSATSATPETATARRGTLTEIVTVAGRIGASEETLLSFRAPQRIASINVSPGDSVEPGQVLMKADERELVRSLASARERLNTVSTKLAQTEEQVAAQQRAVDRRQELARTRGQRSIAAAEAALRRAETEDERVRAGPLASERRAVEASLASARAAVARTQADLERLQRGPDPLDIRLAEQQVATAQQALKRTEDDLSRLQRGDPSLLRAAERDFLTAQNGVARADAELERLVGPDPVAVTAAEREVQRAEMAVRVAQMKRGSSSDKKDKNAERLAQAQQAADIQNARLTLQAAVDRLRVLQAGPSPADVAIARRNVVAARSAFESARDRLEEVRRGPDPALLAQAMGAVDSARIALESASARVNELQAGPDPDQVSAANAAYQSALSSVRTAEAQQAELLARPTRAELADAEDKLKAARDGLEQARAEAETTEEEPVEQPTSELTLMRQAVSQEQAAVQALESDILDSQLVAPTAGVVIAVLAREGVGADAGQPLVILAQQNARPLFLADVSFADGARLTVGQRASLRYSGLTGDPVASMVDRLTDLGGGLVRVEVRPTWPPEPPVMGVPATLQVVLQERQDAVIVPERALRGVGSQRRVEVQEGTGRRATPVDVGLVTGGEAEILNGIEPGVEILVTPG